jgi:hypothetical protein
LCYNSCMKSLVATLLILLSTAVAAAGSGDNLARPPSEAQVSTKWHWIKGQAAYEVQVTPPDPNAVTYAATAVMRHVRPEFQGFGWAQQSRLDLYVLGQHDTDSVQTIYILRNIEADWLIGG